MNNIQIYLAYDGTHYLGWQKTRHGASIEEVLKKTLEQILQHDVKLQAASRTDAGVHALNQSANFFTSKQLNLDKLQLSLNQLLPLDIRINKIETKPQDFHPTLDAKGKIYRYKLSTKNYLSPFDRTTVWHYPKSLSYEKMQEALSFFIGEKDFRGFSNFRKPPHESSICKIFSLEIQHYQSSFDFIISGDHFLYKMVRNIVGTLVYVGANKLDFEDIKSIFSSKKRKFAGVTAPAHGLFLEKVLYEL